MDKKRRIAQLLSRGVPIDQVISILGVSRQYIAGLLRCEEFQAILDLYKTEDVDELDGVSVEQAEAKSLEDKLAAAEHLALSLVSESMPLYDPRNQIAAFQAIGNRRDTLTKNKLAEAALAASSKAGNGQPQTIINLSIPSIVVPELLLSKTNEVMQVGDRSVVPMQQPHLLNIIKETANEPSN